MTALDESISALRVALAQEPAGTTGSRWSKRVRRRLSRVRRLLTATSSRSGEIDAGGSGLEPDWLCPRSAREERRRQALLSRIGEWEPTLRKSALDGSGQPRTVRGPLLRLAADLERYQRRSRLLAFDSVAMEIGGSE